MNARHSVTPVYQEHSVTIAVSAYNEAKSIRAWLEAVVRQKEDGFHIEKILIISDGSTDGTADVARSFSDPRIEVMEHTERRGKSVRLNEMHRGFVSDILVQSDADVVLGNEYVVRNLIQPLIEDTGVGMVGGRALPFPGRTFVERAERCAVLAYDRLRSTVRGGNNIFSVSGQLCAFGREFIERVAVPRDTIGNDMYMYFSCLAAGYRYRYAPSAEVYFHASRTVGDYVRQHTRYEAVPARMEEYFPHNVVRREFAVPNGARLAYALSQFVKHPVLCGFIAGMNAFCRVRAGRQDRRQTALWDVSQTTKKVQ